MSSKFERHDRTAPAARFVPRLRRNAAWERVVDDLRAGQDPLALVDAFDEPLSGLHTRELRSAEVFHSLFGRA